MRGQATRFSVVGERSRARVVSVRFVALLADTDHFNTGPAVPVIEGNYALFTREFYLEDRLAAMVRTDEVSCFSAVKIVARFGVDPVILCEGSFLCSQTVLIKVTHFVACIGGVKLARDDVQAVLTAKGQADGGGVFILCRPRSGIDGQSQTGLGDAAILVNLEASEGRFDAHLLGVIASVDVHPDAVSEKAQSEHDSETRKHNDESQRQQDNSEGITT
jgi:hypothetical protein